MRLEAAVDALHLFLSRAGDAEFEEFLAVFRDVPTVHEGRGTPEHMLGRPKSTASRRASLSFAVDRLIHGLLTDKPRLRAHPVFMVVETVSVGYELDSRCHGGGWGLSGTENLAASIAKRRGGEARYNVVQVLASQMYRGGKLVEEYRYPAEWAEPVAELDQSGFVTAHP